MNSVHGVATVDDELFMLLEENENQVAVHSINDYLLLRHLNVPGYRRDCDNDMTSCVRRRCLYMSDRENRRIHIYQLASNAISKWSLHENPIRLSVTPSGNLLVTCWGEPNKLVEWSPDSGLCVREIALQADIKVPWQSIKMITGQYVVCHGTNDEHLHRVCIIDDDGKVTHSYGGQRGSGVGQLNQPCYLAEDKDSQFIFVADRDNNRVALLSPTLELVRYVSDELSGPRRLDFDHATRRLFVGQLFGRVSIVQLGL